MLKHIAFDSPFNASDLGFCRCDYDVTQFNSDSFSDLHVLEPFHLNHAKPIRKAEYIAGRVCARLALCHLNNHRVDQQNIQIHSHKDRSPQWPSGFLGSISHSKNRAVAITASQGHFRALGIDIESVLSAEEANSIQHSVLNAKEFALQARSGFSPRHFITLAFSAKESCYKACYPSTKIFLDFHDLVVTQVDENTITLCLQVSLNQHWLKGSLFEVQHTLIDKHLITQIAVPLNGSYKHKKELMMTDNNHDERLYQVVINHEEQYSIWLKNKDLPLGWKTVGKEGKKSECLDHIEAVWTDMRPLSLRLAMNGDDSTKPAS